MQRKVFGISFDFRGISSIADAVTSEFDFVGVRLICTANVDHVVNLGKIPALLSAYNSAYLVTADGTPVYIYAKLRGASIPARVTGSDLFPAILSKLNPRKHRPAFIAANDETAAKLEVKLLDLGFEQQSFLIEVPPFGFENNTDISYALAKSIRDLKTTHLFFGVGSPKSEVWIHQNRAILGDLYAFGFGTALDYHAGTARRAPKIFQKTGLEWLWRLCAEPKRLSRRYLLNSWGLLRAIALDMRAGP